MPAKRVLQILAVAAVLCAMAISAQAQSVASPAGVPGQHSPESAATVERSQGLDARTRAEQPLRMHAVHLGTRGKRSNMAVGPPPTFQLGTASSGGSPEALTIQTQTVPPTAPDGQRILPLWTYDVLSARDGYHYPGTVVGRDPFKNPGVTRVPTVVVPLIIKTQTVAVKVDPTTEAILSTEPGVTVFNPEVPDPVCLATPNNVPIKLVAQSPVFTPTLFSFGGTNVGTTQYADAHQRANLWKARRTELEDYHVLLGPVRFLAPIVVEVPAIYGLALTDGNILGPPPFCAPLGMIDFTWFDNYLRSRILPSLTEQGLNPTTFPIFLTYNTWWSAGLAQLFASPNYHSITGSTIPIQTYAVTNFDTTAVYTGYDDIASFAQVVANWMDDPFLGGGAFNGATLWQYPLAPPPACGFYFEPSGPLNGVEIPPVIMPNGFGYHLPELAFMSWFFGGNSIGVNGWFSNNNTLQSDAGPPCHE